MDGGSEAEIQGNNTAKKTGPLLFAGPVRLINGEDSAAYDELLARVTGTLKPVDIMEEIWVRDLADLVWDTLRLRRLKASLLAGCAYQGLQKVLLALGGANVFEISQSWAARDAETVASVDDALVSAGLSMDSVMALTLSGRMDDIDRIERMTMAAEVRRNTALQRIEHYRENFGKRLRGAVEAIEAAEIKTIAPENAPALGQI
jgi:fermentation-respiration switch protein FrsA (DUF1100 family)